MKKLSIFIFLLLCFFAESVSAEDRITALKDQISALEKQKEQLLAEKQTLITDGDGLSYKIEEQKLQSQSGPGIIGRYRLSRNLRRAQQLSEKIQTLEKKIYEIDNETKIKKAELEKEYETQIAIMLQKLNKAGSNEEKKATIVKLNEYQFAIDKLGRLEEQVELRLNTAGIEIKEYDSPQEIREKADLINDLTKKTNIRISILDSRIEKLKDELRTRKKLGEFADEISFFGERVSRGEKGSKLEKSAKTDADNKDKSIPIETDTLTRSMAETQQVTAQPQAAKPLPAQKVMKSSGVSAGYSGMSPYRIEEEIRILEKQRRDLKKELSVLSEKSTSFRKKADEIEKSETKAGEKRDSKRKK